MDVYRSLRQRLSEIECHILLWDRCESLDLNPSDGILTVLEGLILQQFRHVFEELSFSLLLDIFCGIQFLLGDDYAPLCGHFDRLEVPLLELLHLDAHLKFVCHFIY